MKTKTAELTGAVLDWAVAKCEGALHPLGNVVIEGKSLWIAVDGVARHYMEEDVEYNPSTDWAQGGAILEREEICIKRELPCSVGYEWNAWVWTKHIAKGGSNAGGSGPTPLIAAMRCHVASKMGDFVEVPDELA